VTISLLIKDIPLGSWRGILQAAMRWLGKSAFFCLIAISGFAALGIVFNLFGLYGALIISAIVIFIWPWRLGGKPQQAEQQQAERRWQYEQQREAERRREANEQYQARTRKRQGEGAGTQPQGSKKGWWSVLGVSQTASIDEIKRSYRAELKNSTLTGCVGLA
jgi:hypothetical protein